MILEIYVHIPFDDIGNVRRLVKRVSSILTVPVE
jgi:hypothetical protein